MLKYVVRSPNNRSLGGEQIDKRNGFQYRPVANKEKIQNKRMSQSTNSRVSEIVNNFEAKVDDDKYRLPDFLKVYEEEKNVNGLAMANSEHLYEETNNDGNSVVTLSQAIRNSITEMISNMTDESETNYSLSDDEISINDSEEMDEILFKNVDARQQNISLHYLLPQNNDSHKQQQQQQQQQYQLLPNSTCSKINEKQKKKPSTDPMNEIEMMNKIRENNEELVEEMMKIIKNNLSIIDEKIPEKKLDDIQHQLKNVIERKLSVNSTNSSLTHHYDCLKCQQTSTISTLDPYRSVNSDYGVTVDFSSEETSKDFKDEMNYLSSVTNEYLKTKEFFSQAKNIYQSTTSPKMLMKQEKNYDNLKKLQKLESTNKKHNKVVDDHGKWSILDNFKKIIHRSSSLVAKENKNDNYENYLSKKRTRRKQLTKFNSFYAKANISGKSEGKLRRKSSKSSQLPDIAISEPCLVPNLSSKLRGKKNREIFSEFKFDKEMKFDGKFNYSSKSRKLPESKMEYKTSKRSFQYSPSIRLTPKISYCHQSIDLSNDDIDDVDEIIPLQNISRKNGKLPRSSSVEFMRNIPITTTTIDSNISTISSTSFDSNTNHTMTDLHKTYSNRRNNKKEISFLLPELKQQNENDNQMNFASFMSNVLNKPQHTREHDSEILKRKTSITSILKQPIITTTTTTTQSILDELLMEKFHRNEKNNESFISIYSNPICRTDKVNDRYCMTVDNFNYEKTKN
ncbi:hypothetical protein SNEBB_004570 [Seison nebaliae]|nr:hypothetical protein SNEBB_004570 [Seison nebaliae]